MFTKVSVHSASELGYIVKEINIEESVLTHDPLPIEMTYYFRHDLGYGLRFYPFGEVVYFPLLGISIDPGPRGMGQGCPCPTSRKVKARSLTEEAMLECGEGHHVSGIKFTY